MVRQTKSQIKSSRITMKNWCKLLPKHFCLQAYFFKDSVSLIHFLYVCLAQWPRGVAPWYTMKGKFLKFRFADRWKMHFPWNFRVSWGVLKKSWLGRYIQLFYISNLLTTFQMSYIYHQVTVQAYKILIKIMCIINTPYWNETIIILWLNILINLIITYPGALKSDTMMFSLMKFKINDLYACL